MRANDTPVIIKPRARERDERLAGEMTNGLAGICLFLAHALVL